MLFPVAAARRPAKFGKCDLIVGSSSLQAAAWVFKPLQSATLGSLSFQRAGNLQRLVLCSALRAPSVASAYLGRSGLGPHWRERCTRESAARGAGTLPLFTAPGERDLQSGFGEPLLQAQGNPGSPGQLYCGLPRGAGPPVVQARTLTPTRASDSLFPSSLLFP